MQLIEISKQIENATPAEITNLSIIFDQTIQRLTEHHPEYYNFYSEYISDIKALRFSRNPNNKQELKQLVDIAANIADQIPDFSIAIDK